MRSICKSSQKYEFDEGRVGDVLELWAYIGLICSLTDTSMFSFDVSFDKSQRFISVRADSVYLQ